MTNKNKSLVRTLTNQDETATSYGIFCPGCERMHMFDKRWTFNGDFDRPTFTPSMLVYQPNPEKPASKYNQRCHSFVTDGKIKFLSDCTHDMVNQTLELEAF